LIGASSCGLLFWIGRLLFDRAIAFVSGLVAASYLMLVYFGAELLLPVLEVFFDLWIILFLVLAVKRDRWWHFGLCGLAIGLSSITRPNIVVFAPAIAIWLFTLYGTRSPKAWKTIAILAIAVLLPILPVTIRNSVVGHDFVPIASQGGVNFYIGNNPESDGMRAVVPNTPSDWWGGYYATIAMAEQEEGRKLKPSEVSDHYYKKAYEFIEEQPAQAIGLTLSKLRLFWAKWEIPNNKYEEFWAKAFTPIANFLPFTINLVGPLGLLGLFFCFRRTKELFPIWGFIVIYMCTVVAFFVTSRYRIPIVPPLILCAVYGVFQVFRDLTSKGLQSLLAPAIVLILAADLVDGIETGDRTRNLANAYVTVAKGYVEDNQPAKAADAASQALQYNPHYFTAEAVLGEALRQQGDLAGAEAAYRAAIEIPPSPDWGESPGMVGGVQFDLGRLLEKMGRKEEALLQLTASLTPGNQQQPPERLHELIWLLASASEKDVHDPKTALGYARTLCPDPGQAGAQSLDDLAVALAANGQFDEAVKIERMALGKTSSSAYENRLALYEAHKQVVNGP